MARKFITGLVLFTPMAAAADASLVDLIMPDARVVMGIDVARLRSSPLLPSFSNGVEKANPEMQKLMQAAGFDPLRDLEEVIFASPGTGKNPPALVVARGNFDVRRLRAFAESAGSKITEWKGVPILTDTEKEAGAFALLDNIILAGNLDQIKAAIGRRGQGMVLNTEMAMRIADLGRRYDAWMVSIAPLATVADNLPADTDLQGLNGLELLRAIDQVSVGVSMRQDLTMDAEIVAGNGKAAGKLADAIQMLLAMAQQSAKDQPAAMAALHNLKFALEENTIHLGFTVPMADVQQAVADAMNQQSRQAAQVLASRHGPPQADVQVQGEPAPARRAAVDNAPAMQEAAAMPAPRPDTSVVTARPSAKSPRIPANGQILIQSSPKDMGTVVILGAK